MTTTEAQQQMTSTTHGDSNASHAMPDDCAPTSLSSAERSRRYRARKRHGLHRVSIELTQGQISALASLGWPDEETQGDHATIVRAIHDVITTVTLNRDQGRRALFLRLSAELGGTEWQNREVIAAANYPMDPEHSEAVDLVRAAAQRAGIPWSPPDRNGVTPESDDTVS